MGMLAFKQKRRTGRTRSYFKQAYYSRLRREARPEVKLTGGPDGTLFYVGDSDAPDCSLSLVADQDKKIFYLHSLTGSSVGDLPLLLAHALVWIRMAGGGEVFAICSGDEQLEVMLRQGFAVSGQVLDDFDGRSILIGLSLTVDAILPTKS